MTERPPRTVSARVRLLVLSVVAVLVVGAVASAVLRERHMDKAEEAFLSDIADRFPTADIDTGTLDCGESLSAGLFRDETVHCEIGGDHRGQPGRFEAHMPPDFECVDASFAPASDRASMS